MFRSRHNTWVAMGLLLVCASITVADAVVVDEDMPAPSCSTDGMVGMGRSTADVRNAEAQREMISFPGGILHVSTNAYVKVNMDADQTGGTIRILIDARKNTQAFVMIESGVTFANYAVEIAFHPNMASDKAVALKVFAPLSGVDLYSALCRAARIVTPPDWILDIDSGVLSFFPFSDCITGPLARASPSCIDIYDTDVDGDVDLRDFASRQRSFGR